MINLLGKVVLNKEGRKGIIISVNDNIKVSFDGLHMLFPSNSFEKGYLRFVGSYNE